MPPTPADSIARMRIALVSPYSWSFPGGVTRHIDALAREFIASGHHVRVLAPMDPDDRLTRRLHRRAPDPSPLPDFVVPSAALWPWVALVAATGVIFAAFYMLPMVQKVAFNALKRPANRTIPDLNRRELTILMPLVVLILWIGVYPRPFLDRMEPSVNRLVQYLEAVSTPVAVTPPAEPVVTAVAAASSSAPSSR